MALEAWYQHVPHTRIDERANNGGSKWKYFFLNPVIFPKLKSTSKCPVPACTSCLLARSKKISIVTKKQNIVPEKEGILSRDNYKPGNLVSADQFVVNTPGQLPIGYRLESSFSCFHVGTLYNDDATVIIWVENQASL